MSLVQRIYNISNATSLSDNIKIFLIVGLIQKMDYLDNDVLTDGLEDRDSVFLQRMEEKIKEEVVSILILKWIEKKYLFQFRTL